MRVLGVAAFSGCLLIWGCGKPQPVLKEAPYGPFGELPAPPPITPSLDYEAPLEPGEMALRKITDPARIPDFSAGYDHREGLEAAIDHSLEYLAKPSSRRFFPYLDISHERAVKSLERFRQLLGEAAGGKELHDRIVQEFDVYESKGADRKGSVLFTAYYEPVLEARRQPDAVFRYPLYRRPDDLVSDPLTGEVQGRRAGPDQIVPYPTRSELEQSDLLKGLELFYLNDPFDVYVVHIQGSAKLRLGDGRTVRIGYAGSNGRPYTSIKQIMIQDGRIPATSRLREMRAYFKAHPQDVAYYTRMNDRFTFFTERPEGPVGSINVVLTPMRSIATDKSVFPRACLAFVKTQLPRFDENGMSGTVPFDSFALDQDTGGAIRAAGRCDIFIGTGDSAGELAGFVYQPGRLYYLFLKP